MVKHQVGLSDRDIASTITSREELSVSVRKTEVDEQFREFVEGALVKESPAYERFSDIPSEEWSKLKILQQEQRDRPSYARIPSSKELESERSETSVRTVVKEETPKTKKSGLFGFLKGKKSGESYSEEVSQDTAVQVAETRVRGTFSVSVCLIFI